MSGVDRTNEFVALAESCWREHPNVAPVRIRPRAAIALQASALAAQIKRTAALATRLHLLARRRALFDDPAAEINELVPRIKADLQAANGALAEFLTACTLQGGGDPRASVAGTVACTARAHWTLVGEVLREKAVAVAGVLQDALSTRARNLQEHSARRRQIARSNFIPTVQQADSPLWTALQPPQQPPQQQPSDEGAAAAARGTGLRSRRPAVVPVALSPPASRTGGTQQAGAFGPAAIGRPPAFAGGGGGGGSSNRLLPGARVAPSAPPAATPAPHSAPFGYGDTGAKARLGAGGGGAYSYSAQEVAQYHSASNRLEEQLAVESAVVEIGHMMTSLATLVGEQAEIVHRIDADMDITAENVEAGHSELLKYYESVSKHRSFILKMLGSMVALVLMVALVARLWKAPETLPGPGPGPTVT